MIVPRPKRSLFIRSIRAAGRSITQSLLTVGKYPNDAPSLGGAIGYDGEAVAESISSSPCRTLPTHYLDDSMVTTAYKKNVSTITGTMNGSFRGYDPGKCFSGRAGQTR